MENLTPRQKKFADLYMKNGNATLSYKKAGYKCSDENSYSANANRMIRNDKVSAYIKKQQEKVNTSNILSIQEIQEYFSTVIKDEVENTQNKLRAGELLVKMQGGFIDRTKAEVTVRSYEDTLKELSGVADEEEY